MDKAVADGFIEVGGVEIASSWRSLLHAVRVDLSLSAPDRIALTLGDPRGDLLDDGPFSLGSRLRVGLGWAGAVKEVANGTVARLEARSTPAGRTVTVIAYGARYQLQRASGAQTFVDTTVADALTGAAEGVGPELSVAGSSVSVASLLHAGQSPAALVAEWAARLGRVITDGGDAVAVAAPDLSATAPRLTRDADVLDLSITLNTFDQVSQVKVFGVDPLTRETVVGTATEKDALGLVGRDPTGAALTEKAFGARTLEVADLPVHSGQEAQALAVALMNDRLFRFATGTARTRGEASLRAGGLVRLAGFSSRIDGTWYLPQVVHVLRPGEGFETELSLCRPAVGAAS